MFVDFRALKERADIETVARLLNLKGVQENATSIRTDCPACKAQRALIITGPQNAFYCMASKQGGDQLTLASHVLGKPVKDAAQWIAIQLAADQEPPQEKPQEKGALLPLNHLEYDHEALHKMGLPKEFATGIGVGYAKKGVLRGHVAIPIRDPKGTLLMYIGWNPKDGSWKLGAEPTL